VLLFTRYKFVCLIVLFCFVTGVLFGVLLIAVVAWFACLLMFMFALLIVDCDYYYYGGSVCFVMCMFWRLVVMLFCLRCLVVVFGLFCDIWWV